MQADFARLNEQMALARKNSSLIGSPNSTGEKTYKNQLQQLAALRQNYATLGAASGAFSAQTVKVASATEMFNDRIRQQKVGLGELRKSLGMVNQAYQDQMRIQRSSLAQYTSGAAGKNSADLFVPNDAVGRWDQISKRAGYYNQILKSVSTQTVNWGKNTQWAGRQIMVGLTMPIALLAAASAKLAYDADKKLTQIAKVYDTTAQNYVDGAHKQAAADAELNQLRTASLQNAEMVAKRYGQSVSDTLDIEAQLAATGVKGLDLIKQTNEVSRVAMLGDIDRNTAVTESISLSNAFSLSTDQLADKMNFLNAIENGTSLSQAELAESLPKVASAFSQLGGTVEEATVLLVAMKERGVDPVEGANALKSASSRILNPVPKAIAAYNKLGIDIKSITAQAGGNLFTFLKILGAATDGITDNVAKQQALAALFGTYQFNRLNAALDGVSEAFNGTADAASQTAKAVDIMGQSTDQWATIANNEVRQATQSVSGQFKRMVASIKAQLVQFGQPILTAVTPVIGVINKLLTAFNMLPNSVKAASLMGLIFVGLLGPALMLVGITANLVGNLGKLAAAVGGLFVKFKILTPEEKAAELQSIRNRTAWTQEARAANELSIALQGLARANGVVAVPHTGIRQNAAGRDVLIGGTNAAGRSTNGRYANAEQSAANSRRIAQDAAATDRSISRWGSGAATTALMAASMGAMAMGAGQTTQKVLMISTVLALTLPIIGQMVSGMKKFLALNSASNAASGGFLTRIKASSVWVNKVAILSKAAKFAGWAGAIVLAAYGLKKLHDAQDVQQKKQKEINKSAQDWADIIGFTYQQAKGAGQAATQNLASQTLDDVKKLKAANKDLYNELQKAGSDQAKLMDLAETEGIKVRTNGGTAADAQRAVKAALKAGGVSDQDLPAIIQKINLKIDWNNSDSIQTEANKFVQQAMDNAFASIDSTSWKEKTWNAFAGGIGDPSDKAKAQASKAASLLADQFNAAGEDGVKKGAILNAAIVQQNNALAAARALSTEDQLKAYKVNEELAKQFAREAGLNDDQIKQVHTLADARRILKTATTTVEAAEKSYNAILAGSAKAHINLSDSVKLGLLNTARLAAGLPAATNVTEGFGNSAADAAKKLSGLADATEDVSLKASDYVDAQKSAFSGAVGDIYDAADRQLQARNEAQNNALDAKGKAIDAQFDVRGKAQDKQFDAENKAFDKGWDVRTKTVEDSYDAQIKAVDDAIDAEKKADDERQKIFDAEKNRIERLADLFNKNVDFNAALNSGNLDEAAKIQNDTRSQVEQWNVDDQGDVAGKASEARQQALSDQKDVLAEQKQASLDALSDIKDAEQEALKDHQDMLKEQLDNEQKAADARVDVQKDALKKQQDAMQRNLDSQLDILKAFTPRNEKELNEHIGRIEAAYKTYGGNLTLQGKDWGQVVGTALSTNVEIARQTLINDSNWKEVGASISDDVASAFDLTSDQLLTWLKTGVYPSSSSNIVGTVNGTTASQQNKLNSYNSRHSGGPSWSQADRVGIQRSASLYPSEVPTILRQGEFVVNKNATSKNYDLLSAINGGAQVAHSGGLAFRHSGGSLGSPGGTIAAGVSAALSQSLAKSISSNVNTMAAQTATGLYGDAKAGKYGSSTLSAEQLHNAAIILNTGKGMGATSRDLVIALMTALQESSLRNLSGGDRDSVGLFQQRPSQGWGTVAQIMDPAYAAMKFFMSELGVKDRDKLPLTKVAQTVQRSAYPNAYAKWQDEAEAILAGSPVMMMTSQNGTGNASGGLIAPDAFASWLTTTNKQVRPDVLARVGKGLSMIPGGQTIISGYRPGAIVAGTNRPSLHGSGQAVDIGALARRDGGTAATEAEGDKIAAFWRSGIIPGVSEVLWKTLTGGDHYNHVHVGFKHRGGFEMPQMRNGGTVKYDDTIANLHKQETVLTAPLSGKLNEGINQLATGGGTNQYAVTVDLRGAYVKEDIDIEKAVQAGIAAHEKRLGRSRKLGGK